MSDPSDLTALAWWDSSRGAVFEPGTLQLSNWIDRIGGADAAQSSSDLQPYMVPGYFRTPTTTATGLRSARSSSVWAASGAPGVEFTGRQGRIMTSDLSAASGDHTFAAVFDHKLGEQQEWFFGQSASSPGAALSYAPSQYTAWMDASGWDIGSVASGRGSPMVVVWVLDSSGSSRIRVNGVETQSGGTYVAAAYTNLVLGPYTGNTQINAVVRDLVVWDRALSTDDVAAFEAWGVARRDPQAIPHNRYGVCAYGQSNAQKAGIWSLSPGVPMRNAAIGGMSAADLGPGGVEGSDSQELFDTFVDHVRSFAPGRVFIPFSQGEQDATDATLSSNYGTNIAALVTAAEAACPDHDLYWLVEQLRASGTATYTATVRSAQATYFGGLSNASLIDNNDLTLTDGVHYDVADVGTRRDRWSAEAESVCAA